MPQDVKLSPNGRIFYVADKYRAGVWMIRASTFKVMRFIHTGADAHGLYRFDGFHYHKITSFPFPTARYLRFTADGSLWWEKESW